MTTNMREMTCRWHDPVFQDRVHSVAGIGTQLFESTRLVQPGDPQLSELNTARHFFRRSTPDATKYPSLANWFDRGGLVEHSDFAGAIAYQLALEVDKKIPRARINPYANASALELHDLGRVTTHSFMETDVMTDHLWNMIGLREDLHALTHSAHLYWDDFERPPSDLTIAEKISIVADTAGKRSSTDPDRLRYTEEIIPAVANGKKKYLAKINPTFYEKQLIERLPEYSRREVNAINYTLSWFANLGINLNSIIQSISIERVN